MEKRCRHIEINVGQKCVISLHTDETPKATHEDIASRFHKLRNTDFSRRIL